MPGYIGKSPKVRNRKVIHLTASVSRLGGGLFSSVRELSLYTQKVSEAGILVVGLEDGSTRQDVAHWAPLNVRTHRVLGPRGFGYAPSMLKELCVADADIVHLHGLWQYPSLATLRWAQRTRRPYVVSPHGMLEPWALRQSRLKKALVNILYHRACLSRAALLRATSAMEVESIRKAGHRNPVAMIPNGVEVPSELPAGSPRPTGSPRRMLFLSRIHPKKGLLNLVEAWAQLRPSKWELHIMGPNENGHQGEVEAAVRERGLEATVHFPGEVWDDASRTKAYRDADIFVLPTHSENFGLVVAEALACEIPVITTKGAPWGELVSHRCGWWIDIGVEPLVCALKEAFTTSETNRHQMGVRGRELIRSHYGWEPIAKQMIATYRWLLSEGEKPNFVSLG